MLLYLIRHGETDWNLDLRVQGNKDIPLNETGIKQAEILADYFSKFSIDAIYSSDLIRAYETACFIGKKTHNNVTRMEELREINMGLWEGNFWEKIKIEYHDFIYNWENDLENIPIPEGESYGMVQKRMTKAFSNIISNHKNDSNIIVVSHGLALRIFIAYILGLKIQNVHKFSSENASISVVEYDKKYKLISLNNTFHLQRLGNIYTQKF